MKKTNKKQKHRVLVRDVVGLKSRVCRKLKKESVRRRRRSYEPCYIHMRSH